MDERNWNDLWQNDGRSVVRCGKIFILEAVPWIEPLCDHWRERRLHPVQGFAGDQTLACEASVWHTHTHTRTSGHILPHLALLFGLESSASGTALDCGCHPRGIGHQESGVWSLRYSLSMSQYISVLLCPIHLLSLSISFYPCSRKNIMFYLVFLPVPSHMPA